MLLRSPHPHSRSVPRAACSSSYRRGISLGRRTTAARPRISTCGLGRSYLLARNDVAADGRRDTSAVRPTGGLPFIVSPWDFPRATSYRCASADLEVRLRKIVPSFSKRRCCGWSPRHIRGPPHGRRALQFPMEVIPWSRDEMEICRLELESDDGKSASPCRAHADKLWVLQQPSLIHELVLLRIRPTTRSGDRS